MTDVRLTALNPVDSQVYPVACNTSGELLVADGGPDLTVTGDLTVEGTASFDSDVYIDGSARLGIGTLNPAHELHVLDSDKPEIVAEDSTNNVQAYLGAADTNGRVGTLSNHTLQIRTNDTERMTLLTSGNVGINNINPSAKLDVGGTGNFTGDVTAPNISSLMNAVVDLTNRISILEAN